MMQPEETSMGQVNGLSQRFSEIGEKVVRIVVNCRYIMGS
jgi:hypothetical protein